MFRFSEEEDAIKAKVNGFQLGGNAVLQTLSDSWNDRLAHHHLKVERLLEEEKDILVQANETINGARVEDWEVLGNSRASLEKIDSKIETLMASIAALRCKE